ncbi:hypothetical protein EJK80_02415 [Corynebacterium phoceense]|uniref:Helix-turn-helix domain-containing protein n=1 Tax=Corynebacterium phoceense TaxID=1686286 RepID=A0A540R9N4_9CORY|nr:hypothetical protein [Corynebacterium phoceense]TQE44451.1 hypothetical protein EJK80_02415 [Corynebacterium phoceense]
MNDYYDELPFFKVPNWVVERVQDAKLLGVYNVLAYFADYETGMCYPGRRRLADMLGYKRREPIDKAIKALVELGVITVEHRYTGVWASGQTFSERNGQANIRMTNMYRLLKYPPKDSPLSVVSDGQDLAAFKRPPSRQTEKTARSRSGHLAAQDRHKQDPYNKIQEQEARPRRGKKSSPKLNRKQRIEKAAEGCTHCRGTGYINRRERQGDFQELCPHCQAEEIQRAA